ncbi:hypothetical protein [Pseudoruegeria sp. SK021]|uniref:hypothetical protein n=1 Tax=Pseudoruegeria sp. SK021 TaxID=1933035 RepID=UPI00197FA12D|nr:hypothetical protein [Pseudoruegeria sp. SK021]
MAITALNGHSPAGQMPRRSFTKPAIHVFRRESHHVMIDGINNLDYWEGNTDDSARNHFFYYYETGLSAVRDGPWKMHFASKPGGKYYEDMVSHTMPKLFNLRKDPYEKYDGDFGFQQFMKKSLVMQPIIALLSEHVANF